SYSLENLGGKITGKISAHNREFNGGSGEKPRPLFAVFERGQFILALPLVARLPARARAADVGIGQMRKTQPGRLLNSCGAVPGTGTLLAQLSRDGRARHASDGRSCRFADSDAVGRRKRRGPALAIRLIAKMTGLRALTRHVRQA